MRFCCGLILALIFIGAASVRAAESIPHHAAAVGVVRQDKVISLIKDKGGYRSGGLWSERFSLPKAAKLKAVRLIQPVIPRERCDLMTQVRHRPAGGDWSSWEPVNVLPNAGFEGGAPPQGRLLLQGRGEAVERVASAPAPRNGGSTVFWKAIAAPGANLTFSAEVEGSVRGLVGVGARLAMRGASTATVTLTMPREGNAGLQWMAAGMAVPADAATFEGLGVLTTPRGGPPHLQARRGMLRFEPELPAAGLIARDDFSQPKRWENSPDVTWTEKPSALSLVVKGRRPASVRQLEEHRFEHQGWLEVRANLTLKQVHAAINVLLLDAEGRPLSEPLVLRVSGRDGTYRVWGRGPVPEQAGRFRVVLQAARGGQGDGLVTFHRVELRAVDPPPAFQTRPSPEAIGFPKPVPAEEVEVRTFLLTADPAQAPSFKGYELEFE
jgi:hypothetical protein